MFFDPQRIVTAAIERFTRNTSEVAIPGLSDIHLLVEKVVHAIAPQGHHAPDGHTFPQFKSGN